MADRLSELTLGLRRLTENAKLRGDDLKYVHQQEDYEHIKYLDELLVEVQSLHNTLIDERKRFMVVEHPVPTQLNKHQDVPPKFLQQGPRKDQVNG
jgi:hypothetical protein